MNTPFRIIVKFRFHASVCIPTLTFQVVDVGNLPIILDKHHKFDVEENVKKAFTLSKSDWDSFETSWDFKRHPLV